jgi:anaerobic selenocysteine-containing dehydrogenase
MCGVAITRAQDGVIASIKGDADDPFSHGHVCPKAIGLKSLQDDPDRLRRPLKRTASGWQEITWDQAFDEVDQGIRRIWKNHDRRAVAVYAGNPTVHSLGAIVMLSSLLAALRTRNRFSATSLDQLPQMLASLQMFGHQLLLPVPDVDNTGFLLMLGANPAASNGSLMSGGNIMARIKGIVARGGRVVTLDPRRSETAEQVGEHHFIRPESDVYFLAALLHTVFAERLADPGPLGEHIEGLDHLKRAVAAFTPEAAAPLTGIPAATIRQLAHDFAAAPRAVCYGRVGICNQQHGALAAWLVNALNVVTGNMDAVGGALFTQPAVDIVGLTAVFPGLRGGFDRYRSRVRGLPEFNGELPAAVLAEEMLTPGEGQIRALVTHAGNPVLSAPNGRQLDTALAQLDFMVAIDCYLNETTRHAHLILPPTGPLERGHYDLVFNLLAVRNVAKYSPPMLDSAPDAKHDWQILSELAARLGANTAQERWLWKGVRAVVDKLKPEGLLDLMLRSGPYGGMPRKLGRFSGIGSTQLLRVLKLVPAARPLAQRMEVFLAATALRGNAQGITLAKLKTSPHGIDLGALQPSLRQRLCTNNGMLHLAPVLYLEGLRQLQATFAKPVKPDQFVVIGRRQVRSNNSWMHNCQPLIKGRDRCTVEMHPADATRLKAANGDTLRVKSRVGQIDLPLEISDAMMPGVISIPHGFGHNRSGIRMALAQEKPGASLNDITDEMRLDTISGNAAFSGVPVRISKLRKPSVAP